MGRYRRWPPSRCAADEGVLAALCALNTFHVLNHLLAFLGIGQAALAGPSVVGHMVGLIGRRDDRRDGGVSQDELEIELAPARGKL